MKKLILSIVLFVLLFLLTSSRAYAQSADCWKEYSDVKPICDQVITNQSLLDKCDQANKVLHMCLGVDKEPWTLQSSKPGHLTCQEWKKLMIVGTAQNCVAPLSEIFERKLWCLSSVAEMSQVRSHPVDYILDFDPNSCVTTEDDLKQFKADLPLTSESSSEVFPKKTNEKDSKFNIFGINPFETWLNLRGLAELGAYFKSEAVIQDAEYMFSPGFRTRMEKEAKAKEFAEKLKFIEEAETRFADLSQQDKIKAGEIRKELDARFELYPMNGQKGILEPGENWPMLKSGAIDVIVKPQNDQQFKIQTPNAEIMVIGTEFSIIYDQEKGETLVVVYKGKVEVKTKDGKTIAVAPNGDPSTGSGLGKPGVVMVSQKLSPTKLALAGVVLAAVLGSVIMILRRKFSPKGLNKKRK